MARSIFAALCVWLFAYHVAAQELPSAMVPLAGSKIYVTGEGNNSKKLPPIIFVHAGFQDHTMWTEQAREFMKDRIVLMIDLPGHGRSKDGPEAPQATSVIKVVMDSLYIQRAVLVGSSFGGAVIMDFALAHPDRISKMILAAPGIAGWEQGRQLDSITTNYFMRLNDALKNQDTTAAAEVFTRYWFDGMRSKDEVSPLLRDLVFTTTKNTMKQHNASGWPKLDTMPAIKRLSEIKIPTLIITGTKDLPELLLMNGYLVNNLPNAKQVMVSGAGHMVNMEQPERFNSEIRKFLTQPF